MTPRPDRGIPVEETAAKACGPVLLTARGTATLKMRERWERLRRRRDR